MLLKQSFFKKLIIYQQNTIPYHNLFSSNKVLANKTTETHSILIIKMSKFDYLPTMQDAYESLLPQQLEILRQVVVSEGGDAASIQSRFNYAWALVKSSDINNERLGIKLLTDIFKEAPSRRRECLYYLTVGCYKVNEFTMAKRYVDILYENEPNNLQVVKLKKMVESKIQSETWIGIAVATGVVATAATLTGFLMRSRRK